MSIHPSIYSFPENVIEMTHFGARFSCNGITVPESSRGIRLTRLELHVNGVREGEIGILEIIAQSGRRLRPYSLSVGALDRFLSNYSAAAQKYADLQREIDEFAKKTRKFE